MRLAVESSAENQWANPPAPRASNAGGRTQQSSAKENPEMPSATNRFGLPSTGTDKPMSRRADARKSLAPASPVSDNVIVSRLSDLDAATSNWIRRNGQQSRSRAIILPTASSVVRDALTLSRNPFDRDSTRVTASFS